MAQEERQEGQGGKHGAAAPYHHGDLRAALLAAAEAELAEKGLEGFSLRGTARRAGVSHAAPAHHFAGADGLLAALASLGFERLAAATSERMAAAGDDPRARLAASGRGYVAFATADPHLFRLMFFGERPRALAGDAAPGRAFALLADTVAAIRGADASPAEIARDIAAAWGLVHGLSHLLIEGAAGFLDRFGEAERAAILDAALDRFARSL